MELEVRELTYAYGTRPVLRGVSFDAKPGALTAVLGPNGAGKSTLFRCILGLLPGYTGTVRMNGAEVSKMNPRTRSRCAAYIPQTTAPVFHYTVLEMVLMGMAGQLHPFAVPGSSQTAQAKTALERLGISELAHRDFSRISGGERQLTLIARAMAQGAELLIMDEPTANLDYGNQHRVMEQIRALCAAGYSVLLATHNPDHALRYATDALILENGLCLAVGTAREVLTGERLSRLYGLPVTIEELPGDPPCRVCVTRKSMK